MEKCRTYISRLLTALLLFFPAAAFAASADVILENIDQQLPYLSKAVTGGAYLFGILIVIKGISRLKMVAHANSMMGQDRHIFKEAITHIVLGIALLYIPSSLNTMLTSFYGTSNITPYSGYGASEGAFNEMGQVIVNIVQFVGLVAFIRGMILFHRVGVGQAQQGTFNKGLTHLIGGIIAINVVQFANIIGNTLGINV